MVTFGRMFSFAAECREKLESQGLAVKLLKLNRIIPLDPAAVEEALPCSQVFFLEEGVQRGGLGEHFGFCLQERGFRRQLSPAGHRRPLYSPTRPCSGPWTALGLNARRHPTVDRRTLQEKGESRSEKTT